MSFSVNVKNELFTQEVAEKYEKARLYSYIRLGSSLLWHFNGVTIQFSVKNTDLVNELINLFKKVNIEISIKEKLNNRNDKKPIYIIEANGNDICKELDLVNDNYFPNPNLNTKIIRKGDAYVEFIRAAFLFHGSINDPNALQYHLEMVFDHEGDAKFAIKILEEYNIKAKIINRAKGCVVYIKSGEANADFLKLIGAMDTLFDFENIRINRDMTNMVNRIENCDIANSMKTQKSAEQQLDAIDFIYKSSAVASLSVRLQDAITLRKENPDSSLSELSELSEDTVGHNISKSSLAHCFKDIMTIAENSGWVKDDKS